MTELRNTDAGRILLGLLILTIGAFLVLINLQLSSFQVVGLCTPDKSDNRRRHPLRC